MLTCINKKLRNHSYIMCVHSYVWVVESSVYIAEDTGSNPMQCRRKKRNKYLSCLVLYKVHWLCLTGTLGAHTGSGRHGWYLQRAPCPGSRSAHSTGTSYLLSAQVPWLVQERVTCLNGKLDPFSFYTRAQLHYVCGV